MIKYKLCTSSSASYILHSEDNLTLWSIRINMINGMCTLNTINIVPVPIICIVYIFEEKGYCTDIPGALDNHESNRQIIFYIRWRHILFYITLLLCEDRLRRASKMMTNVLYGRSTNKSTMIHIRYDTYVWQTIEIFITIYQKTSLHKHKGLLYNEQCKFRVASE